MTLETIQIRVPVTSYILFIPLLPLNKTQLPVETITPYF
jgi:hypothetical protein